VPADPPVGAATPAEHGRCLPEAVQQLLQRHGVQLRAPLRGEVLRQVELRLGAVQLVQDPGVAGSGVGKVVRWVAAAGRRWWCVGWLLNWSTSRAASSGVSCTRVAYVFLTPEDLFSTLPTYFCSRLFHETQRYLVLIVNRTCHDPI
jgi:hypothetical protein